MDRINRDVVAQTVKELTNEVTQYNDQLKKGNSGLIEKKKLLKELAQVEKEIASYRKDGVIDTSKGKDGLSEADKLAKALERKKQLTADLKDNFAWKEDKKTSSSSNSFAFDTEANERELKRKQEDIAHEANIQRIKIEEDGFNERIALQQAEGERSVQLLIRQKEDKMRELEKLSKEAKKAGKDFDLEGAKAEWGGVFDDQINAQIEKNCHEGQQLIDENLKTLLDKYQTYEDQKEAIRKKYAEQRELLEKSGKSYDKNALAQAEAEDNLAVEKKAGKLKSTIGLIFSDLSGKTKAELQKIRDKAQALYDFLKKGDWNPQIAAEHGIGSKEEFNALRETESMSKIGGETKKLNQLAKTFGQTLKDAFKGGSTAQGKLSEDLQKVFGKMQAGIALANMFASSLQSIADITGNDGFGEVAKGIGKITKTASATMQGVQAGAALGPAGMVAGGILGAASSILGGYAEAAKRHREYMAKMEVARIKRQRIYNNLLFEEMMKMKDLENIFSVDALGKGLRALDIFIDKKKELDSYLKPKAVEYTVTWRSVVSGENPMGHQIGETFTKWENELDKIQLKRERKDGKDTIEYTVGLTEVYDDLITKEGELNIKKVDSILQTENLSEAEKERLQKVKDSYDEAKKAEEAYANYLKSTFGELGKGMMDGVINSLKNGEDAFESFGKSVANVMLKLGKDMAVNSIIQPILTQMSNELKDKTKAWRKAGKSNEEVAKGMAGIIKGYMGQLKTAQGDAKNFLEAWQKDVQDDFDVDILGDDQRREADKKGFAQMSQDTGSELGNKFTLMTELSRQNVEIAKGIASDIKYLQTNSAKMLEHLVNIDNNTATLHQMKADISLVKSGIEDINTRGIKIR